MKVLLDENLDHALRRLLQPHEVFTVAFLGWAGLKNGELLTAAERQGIQVLLTGDTTLHMEQNLTGRQIAVVALSAMQLPILIQHIPLIEQAIAQAEPGSYRMVDCGVFRRNRQQP